jgi:4'-phosphopantetheinyl transferase EntD
VTNTIGSWQNLDNSQDRQEPFGLPWAVHFAVGQIADYRDQLAPEALQPLLRAVPKRQNEFATGRVLAAHALKASGSADTQVNRGDNRQPLWPVERVGSISHNHTLAWAAVCKVGTLRGLGVDIEEVGRLGKKLFNSVFTEAEQKRYATSTAPQHWADILFSAKEAIYKAVNPITDHYIGFHEVDVTLSADAQRFTVRYVGENEANAVMHLGDGYSLVRDGHVLTLFAIPPVC